MLRKKFAIGAVKTKDTTFSTYLPKHVGNCVSVMKLNIILVNKYALWKTYGLFTWSIAKNSRNICKKFAKNLRKICEKFAKYSQKIREKFAKNSQKINIREFFWIFSQIFRKYFANFNFSRIFREYFANFSRQTT